MAPKTDTRRIDASAIKRAERIAEAVESIDKCREEYRQDACYITEIIRSLRASGPDNVKYSYSNESTVPSAELVVDRYTKYGMLLLDWQKELMNKAGFETMDELKKYFFEHVGEENW